MFDGNQTPLHSLNFIWSQSYIYMYLVCTYYVSKLMKDQKRVQVYRFHRAKLPLKWVVCLVSSYCGGLQHGDWYCLHGCAGEFWLPSENVYGASWQVTCFWRAGWAIEAFARLGWQMLHRVVPWSLGCFLGIEFLEGQWLSGWEIGCSCRGPSFGSQHARG